VPRDRVGARVRAADYLAAARVPAWLPPQAFGAWKIERHDLRDLRGITDTARHGLLAQTGWPTWTALRRLTLAQMHLDNAWDVVMEDSVAELRRHLPIWLAARGRVLVTGLGLGCVVRGLLASPDVRHVDVVEIDPDLLRVVGAEFAADPRVTLHLADAFRFARRCGRRRWDYAWHDLWRAPEDEADGGLHVLHARLLLLYEGRCGRQGAWTFPRDVARIWPRPLLGARRRRPA
jgi:hypothetical protein